MPNLGMNEIFLILVVVLLLFGAKRIPEIVGSVGKGIREFKKNMNEAQQAVMEPDRGNERLSPPAQFVQHDDTPEREPKKLMRKSYERIEDGKTSLNGMGKRGGDQQIAAPLCLISSSRLLCARRTIVYAPPQIPVFAYRPRSHLREAR